MRGRYFWPLFAVNAVLDAEIVAHTLLPVFASLGGLIGILAGGFAITAIPYWWPRRTPHESDSGALWWTLRHPRRRWWMWRHGEALAAQYEAEKRAEWDRVKTQVIDAEPQCKPLPSSGARDAVPRAILRYVASEGESVDEVFYFCETWLHHRVLMDIPSSAGAGWKVLDGNIGRVWAVEKEKELILKVLLADHTSVDIPAIYCVRIN